MEPKKHDWLQAHDGRLARITAGPYEMGGSRGFFHIPYWYAVDERGNEMTWFRSSAVWRHCGPNKPAPIDLDAMGVAGE